MTARHDPFLATCRYRYYNWRRDTASDLILILVFNLALVAVGAVVKFALVDPVLSGGADDPSRIAAQSTGIEDGPLSPPLPFYARLWPDIYQIILLTFGESFPAVNESWVFQLYSIGMGLVGVLGFALVLALTEQLLLEILDSNVRTGTRVFERGHILVLAHCVAGKDMEALWRVLNQARSLRSLRSRSHSHSGRWRTIVAVLYDRRVVYRSAMPAMPQLARGPWGLQASAAGIEQVTRCHHAGGVRARAGRMGERCTRRGDDRRALLTP